MNKYTVDYFENKFKKINNNRWITGQYYNQNKTKFCILGHCGVTMIKSTHEAMALFKLFKKVTVDIIDMNDGRDEKYRQKTPRSRVLAALRDIRKEQGAR